MNKQKKKSLGLFLLGLFAISGLILGATIVTAQTQQNYHRMSDGTIMSNDAMITPMNGNANSMMGLRGNRQMTGGQLNEREYQEMHKQCMKMMDDDDFDSMHQTTGTRQ